MLERYTIKVIIMFHSNFLTNLVVFSQIIDSFLIHNQPKYITTSLVMTNVYNLNMYAVRMLAPVLFLPIADTLNTRLCKCI